MPTESKTMARERLRKETALADLRQMEAARLAGELLDREETIKTWAQACGRLRDRMLAIPERVSAALQGRTEAEIRVVLRAEVEDALRGLSS